MGIEFNNFHIQISAPGDDRQSTSRFCRFTRFEAGPLPSSFKCCCKILKNYFKIVNRFLNIVIETALSVSCGSHVLVTDANFIRYDTERNFNICTEEC